MNQIETINEDTIIISGMGAFADAAQSDLFSSLWSTIGVGIPHVFVVSMLRSLYKSDSIILVKMMTLPS